MFNLRIRDVLDKSRLIKATPDMTVSAAAKLMAFEQVGAVVVLDAGRLSGIFTERDVVFRVVAPDLDPSTTRLSAVMTPAPLTIEASKSFGYALLLMHENRFRHLPVIDGGVLIGMVSARHALDPELEEFVVETQRRVHFRREAG